MFNDSRGFTIIELLVVIGIITIMATVSIVALSSRRVQGDLTNTAKQMVSILHDAQSRSVSQSRGASWAVHFENSASGGFYAIYSGAYALSSTQGYYSLPANVKYDIAFLPVGSSTDVIFEQLTGTPNGGVSIVIKAVSGPSSSTIRVSPNGLIGT